MDDRGEMRRTRRLFRYDEEHQLDRIQQTSKQRRYKQLLDEQVEQNRRRQQERLSQEVQEKAWYVHPTESYQPRLQESQQRSSVDEEKHGMSKFITEPAASKQPIPVEDDEQVKSYLEECEKILHSLKGLTNSPQNVDSQSTGQRKFIRYNRSRQTLDKNGLSQLEERYNRKFGALEASKLPRITAFDFLIPKNNRNKDNMAIIINPTPCTHGQPQEDPRQRKKQTIDRAHSKDVLKVEESELSQIKNTVKMKSSREGSLSRLLDRDDEDLKVKPSKPREKESDDRLVERSRKSQLQVNKQRFRSLVRQSDQQSPNPQQSPIKSSQDKRGSRIMVHLIRVKAHGYKLFEKVKRYSHSKHDASLPLNAAANN